MFRHVLLFDYLTLCILSTTNVLFGQPGETKSVILVSIGGKKVIRGGHGIADGPVDHAKFREVMGAVNLRGFGNLEENNARLGVLLGNCVLLVSLYFGHQLDWLNK